MAQALGLQPTLTTAISPAAVTAVIMAPLPQVKIVGTLVPLGTVQSAIQLPHGYLIHSIIAAAIILVITEHRWHANNVMAV